MIPPEPFDENAIREATKRWIATLVVGLNLCPFARRVVQGDLIRFCVVETADPLELFDHLTEELRHLVRSPITETETTFVIHPHALLDFQTYLDFLGDADRLLADLRLTGVIQIAGFHPRFRFDNSGPDEVGNYTNRSPYPMLHLLREESISNIADDPDMLLDIPRRNVETLQRLGLDEVRRLLATCHEDRP